MYKKPLYLLVILCAFFFPKNIYAQSWKWGLGSICPSGVIESWAIGYDAAGNIYSGGAMGALSIPVDSVKSYFGADSVQGSGLVLVSADSTGHYRWARGAKRGGIENLAVDAAGNVYLFGYFRNTFTLDTISITGSFYACFCAKLNSSGRVLWMKHIGDSVDCTGNIDPSGNIILAGKFNAASLTLGSTTLTNANPGAHFDVFLAKLDPSGTPIWATSFGGDSTELVTYTGVSTNSAGDIYLTGTYLSPSITIGSTTLTNPTGNIAYGYTAKFSASGTPLWAQSVSFTSVYSTQLNGQAVDAWGNVYVTGEFMGSMTMGSTTLTAGPYGQMFLAKYNGLGALKWVVSNSNYRYNNGYDVAPDVCGNVWMCGKLIVAGMLDESYLFNFDTTGVLHDSLFLISGGDDQLNIIADNAGNLYMAGDYAHDSTVIGPDTLRLLTGTNETLFLARYTYPICSIPTLDEKPIANSSGGIVVYPNPANDELYIQSSTVISRVDVVDITGRLVSSSSFNAKSGQISVGFLKQGVYLLRIITEDNTVSTRKIVISH